MIGLQTVVLTESCEETAAGYVFSVSCSDQGFIQLDGLDFAILSGLGSLR